MASSSTVSLERPASVDIPVATIVSGRQAKLEENAAKNPGFGGGSVGRPVRFTRRRGAAAQVARRGIFRLHGTATARRWGRDRRRRRGVGGGRTAGSGARHSAHLRRVPET